jgi:hypothetical protein
VARGHAIAAIIEDATGEECRCTPPVKTP